MEECKITETEQKTRKQWLFSTAALLFLFPLAVFVFFVAFFKLIHVPGEFLFRELGSCMGGLIPLWIIWHCCYRKYGTRLITLWLFASPLSQVREIYGVIKEGFNPIVICVAAIELGLFVWWYLLSLRIRKLNKSAREKALLAA